MPYPYSALTQAANEAEISDNTRSRISSFRPHLDESELRTIAEEAIFSLASLNAAMDRFRETHGHFPNQDIENLPRGTRADYEPTIDWTNVAIQPEDPAPTPDAPPLEPSLRPANRRGPVTFSPELRAVLSRVQYDSPVAAYLLDRYFTTTDEVDHLHLEEDGTISFLPAGKVGETYADGTYRPHGRQRARAAKAARRALVPNTCAGLSDKDFETFGALMRANNVAQSAEFALVSGERIGYWYHYDRYDRTLSHGSLVTSCMRHDECGDYFGIYEENPDHVRMLILVSTATKKLIGRALVWRIPGLPHSAFVLDRIYGNDVTIAAFREYAISKGWYYRRDQTYEHPMEFMFNRSPVRLRLRVRLPNIRFYAYPYLDTLKYLDARTGTLSNDSYDDYTSKLDSIKGESGVDWAYYPEPRKEVTDEQETPLLAWEEQQDHHATDSGDIAGDGGDDHDCSVTPEELSAVEHRWLRATPLTPDVLERLAVRRDS